MNAFRDAVHHPRKLWVRKLVIQLHLWAGLLITLYLVAIALSGSILVFEAELTGYALPRAITRELPARPVSIEAVVSNVERRYPGATIEQITVPSPDVPAYQIVLRRLDHRRVNVVGDATTGAVVDQSRTWVQWVHDLHIYLLLEPRYGLQVNAIGAAVLMLLTVTGLVLWWPGVRAWTRGLRVNVRANWRRINYDLHIAIGFWTLAIVFWWALSGVYFGFYKPVAAAVNVVFPVRNMHAPMPLQASGGTSRVSLERILQAAQAASPRAHLYTLSNVSLKGPTVYASMDLAAPGDFLHRDIVCLDASDGRVLSVWHYAEKHSIGDWILWLMHPLHFGTLWGTAVKAIWCLLGLALAVLSVTGALMYWNRWLRHRFS